MNAAVMEAQRVKAFKDEWETFSVDRANWDMRAEWVRHFGDLGLTLDQFTGSVLDIGCGPTGAIYYLPNLSRRVGIDPAASSFTRWNIDHRERYQIELIEAGAERLDFPDASFDSVFCINCLDHTTDPESVVTEIHRVLKPDGRIVLFFDMDSPLRKLHKKVRPTCGLMHPHSFDCTWVDRVIVSSGLFKIERMCRDQKAFEGLSAKLYEAYWDDLVYRTTGWKKFIHHLWMTGVRA
jgi:ubiquinone/menaquinone biosynthesis C-methylase UbiE